MRNLLRLNSNQREYAAAGPSATYSLTSPPLPLPLALMFCSSRTVNKNRLHVKLCLASVKRSSTIDSNSPEHDVASVPPATTSLLPLPPPLLTLPSWCCNFACPLATPFGWLCLRLRFLSFWPSFILFFGTFIIIFLFSAHFSRFYVFWTLLSRRAAGIK